MARVSGARSVCVWPCTIVCNSGIGRYFIYTLKALVAAGSRGSEEGKPYKLKQGVRPNNCQDSKFLLGLMVGQLTLWSRLGEGREPMPAILI